jgi:hypothetical protein
VIAESQIAAKPDERDGVTVHVRWTLRGGSAASRG